MNWINGRVDVNLHITAKPLSIKANHSFVLQSFGYSDFYLHVNVRYYFFVIDKVLR